MEAPKVESFCCPICGNSKNFWVRFVNATLHFKEFKDGHITDYEHDVEIRDTMIWRFDCLECQESVWVNDLEKIKLTTEPQ